MAETAQPTLLHGNTLEVAGFDVEMGYLDRHASARGRPARVSTGGIRVRLYRNAPATPRPLLLWLHGGGFVGGTLDDIDVACASLARRAGLTVISLEYRLAPEHPFPAALHNTYDALAWLEEHGEAFGGDGRVVPIAIPGRPGRRTPRR